MGDLFKPEEGPGITWLLNLTDSEKKRMMNNLNMYPYPPWYGEASAPPPFPSYDFAFRGVHNDFMVLISKKVTESWGDVRHSKGSHIDIDGFLGILESEDKKKEGLKQFL